MKRTILFTAVLSFSGVASAAAPATRPATRPVDVDALVQRLGAEEFKDREAAGAELRKLGPDALPALKEARKHPDPEVQARAAALAKEIEQAARRQVRPRPPGLGNNVSRSTSTMRMTVNGVTTTRKTETVVMNGRKEVNVTEDARSVHIVEDAEGIQVRVTDTVGGKEQTQAYDAKDLDELRSNEPEGFAIYEAYAQEHERPPMFRGRRDRLRLRELPGLPE